MCLVGYSRQRQCCAIHVSDLTSTFVGNEFDAVPLQSIIFLVRRNLENQNLPKLRA